MKCGVKFCGGCNPRFERGEVYRYIKDRVESMVFEHVSEDETYDLLLVIGGCPSCCASYEQYALKDKENVYKIWDISQLEKTIEKLTDLQL